MSFPTNGAGDYPYFPGGNRGITTTVNYSMPLIARIGLDVSHDRDSFSHGRLIPDFNARGATLQFATEGPPLQFPVSIQLVRPRAGNPGVFTGAPLLSRMVSFPRYLDGGSNAIARIKISQSRETHGTTEVDHICEVQIGNRTEQINLSANGNLQGIQAFKVRDVTPPPPTSDKVRGSALLFRNLEYNSGLLGDPTLLGRYSQYPGDISFVHNMIFVPNILSGPLPSLILTGFFDPPLFDTTDRKTTVQPWNIRPENPDILADNDIFGAVSTVGSWVNYRVPPGFPGSAILLSFVQSWPGSDLFYFTGLVFLVMMIATALLYSYRAPGFMMVIANTFILVIMFALGFIPLWMFVMILPLLALLLLNRGKGRAVV